MESVWWAYSAIALVMLSVSWFLFEFIKDGERQRSNRTTKAEGGEK